MPGLRPRIQVDRNDGVARCRYTADFSNSHSLLVQPSGVLLILDHGLVRLHAVVEQIPLCHAVTTFPHEHRDHRNLVECSPSGHRSVGEAVPQECQDLSRDLARTRVEAGEHRDEVTVVFRPCLLKRRPH